MCTTNKRWFTFLAVNTRNMPCHKTHKWSQVGNIPTCLVCCSGGTFTDQNQLMVFSIECIGFKTNFNWLSTLVDHRPITSTKSHLRWHHGYCLGMSLSPTDYGPAAMDWKSVEREMMGDVAMCHCSPTDLRWRGEGECTVCLRCDIGVKLTQVYRTVNTRTA